MSRGRIPLSQRPDFASVSPIEQDDGPNPLASIAYREDFAETMGYFRALYVADERSPRSLTLTAEAISMNAGNYTVWQFRRLILEALNVNLMEELVFVESVAKSNPKNYQIWHHRRWVSEKLETRAMSNELEFTRKILQLDGKNYHAWSHRQWVLQTMGGWEDELEFCHELLVDDIFNNSAWNQRHFVVSRSPIHGGLRTLRVSEVDYTIKTIAKNPENESPWRYLRGLYKADNESWITDPTIPSLCLKVLLMPDPTHLFALTTLLDLLCHGFKPDPELQNAIQALTAPKMDPSGMSLAGTVCSILARRDPMRVNYWAWRRSKLPKVVLQK